MSLDVTGIEEQTGVAIRSSLRVFPNPASGRTTVSYCLPRSGPASCIVYDAAGNLVSRLATGNQAAGEHQLTWNTADVKPGIYYCKLVTGNSTSVARLARVR